MGSLTESFAGTRRALHRVATHVLARRRFEVSGWIGLRPSPAGIATPAFGDGSEVVRIAGPFLVHEVGGDATFIALGGATLGRLAAVVGTDLSTGFVVGTDTPALGDPDEVLRFDDQSLEIMAAWYQLGGVVLDATVAALGSQVSPATLQLWPEHFDVATSVTCGSERAGLGFSPGDASVPEPYLYVQPWSDRRPGGGQFWNAPFGAVLRRSEVVGMVDPAPACRVFLDEGLRRLSPD